MKYSIVIPVHNKVEFTHQCIQDILSSNIHNYECIVIDNASTDSTPSYLTCQPDLIKVITNKKNRGCAKSWNQGVSASFGEWVVILNNDVRLPKDWLVKLVTTAEKYNVDVISPSMREGPLNYNFEKYAVEFVLSMKNIFRKWTPNGACFAVKRNVFDKVGLFDENFKIGQYEDADFFRRCKLSNISMGITGNSFIHHFGSSTQILIKENKLDYPKLNQKYHRSKWNIGFFRRHWERYKEQLLIKYWSYFEYRSKKHSLLEKFRNGRLYYH